MPYTGIEPVNSLAAFPCVDVPRCIPAYCCSLPTSPARVLLHVVDGFYAKNNENQRRKLGLSKWDDNAQELWDGRLMHAGRTLELICELVGCPPSPMSV